MAEKPRYRPEVSDREQTSPLGGVGRMTRRAVLRAGTIGAAAVGAASAFPSFLGELSAAGPEVSGGASEATAAASEAEAAAALDGPIVAHIKDAATGEISLYVGEREVAYRDSALVNHLIRATR